MEIRLYHVLTLCLLCGLRVIKCLTPECTNRIWYTPVEQLSLCTRKYLTATRISLVPDLGCGCRLVIPARAKVSIAARTELSPSSERCASETFLLQDDVGANIQPFCEDGACLVYESVSQPSTYTISYSRKEFKDDSLLRLRIEALPDAKEVTPPRAFTLQCGYSKDTSLGGPDKMQAFGTTNYWTNTPTALRGTTSSHASKPTGSRAASSSSSSSSSSSPAATTLKTTTKHSNHPATTSTNSMASTAAETNPDLSGDEDASRGEPNIFQQKSFVLALSIALCVTVLIMIFTAAIGCQITRKKKLRSSKRHHKLKRYKKGLHRVEDEENNEQSDHDEVFRVTNSTPNDAYFQY